MSIFKEKRIKNHRLTSLGIILAGLLLIGLGVYRGEVYVVLTKAVHICLECIGIG